MKGTSFKNAVLRNVSFKYSDVKKATFDSAVMDKVNLCCFKRQQSKSG
ncbi:pentapeptide repeat-containing protein [Geosporobacter ferrireducens]